MLGLPGGSKKVGLILLSCCCWVWQEVSNFVERCNAVAVNLVQQLSSLYRPKDNRLYKTTFKAVQLLPVYRYHTPTTAARQRLGAGVRFGFLDEHVLNALRGSDVREVPLGDGCRSLSDLLRVLITLDSIILQNPHLLPCWAQYKVRVWLDSRVAGGLSGAAAGAREVWGHPYPPSRMSASQSAS